ncbi:hypothetical protein NFO65_15325 [Neorhizobium galegae]|uniref:hypothetical protein n=1 Tax=Neorhizobium galegae TaxID=399 RepID=UPI002101D1AA|nr:hypothetical protein [Neorhizobium galegae]MCQ1572102.1 hypothetical protein [Neorhizobium galegae]
MDAPTLSYDLCVVTFIDILGFRAIVQRDNPISIFKRLTAMRRINGIDEPDEELSFHAFSDSIVRVRRIRGSVSEAVGLEANDIGLAQMDLFHEGVLIRGGLTVGQCYGDRNIVFGPAVIRAYDIESNLAKHPIVAIDPEVRRDIDMVQEFPNRLNRMKGLGPLIAVGEEGETWVDYLSISRQELDEDADVLEGLAQHKVIIDRGLSLYDEPRIRSKYEWLAAYHNNFCMGYAHIDTLPLLVRAGLTAMATVALQERIREWRKRPYGETHDICGSEHDGREEDDFGEEDHRNLEKLKS